ncbi:substrate-binding periplasmic protein [Legionella lytica]|uniref:Substrate-binding periplasmic protein n=1 Tax=Legionella lytica TaxID=96232 RepID=A0ABW8D617_9GAMM
MKKIINIVAISFSLVFSWCYAHTPEENKKFIHFATSAEYPPFEYNERGEIKGFDIDLGRLIAKQLGKEVVFDSMQFSSILPALSMGQVDAAISTLTITDQRKKNFDFSSPYYFESLAVVYSQEQPINNVAQLANKKIAVQLGSTMEIWLKSNIPNATLLVMDNNNQAIAALKAGHAEAVVVDGAQGASFSQKNPGLSFKVISKSNDGYGVALKKNSPLTHEINKALQRLEQNGELAKLKQKWFGGV